MNAAGTCAAALVLAPTASCTLEAGFLPSANGAVSQALTINVQNMTPLLLTLAGDGRFLASTSTAVTLTAPTGALTYGQTATFTAKVTPSPFNVASATGLVTFVINGVSQKPVALQSDGTASIETTALSGGANSVYASYDGDDNYQPSTSPVVTSTVAPAATSSTLTLATMYVNPYSQPVGAPLTMTAYVQPSVAGVLSGTVNFMSGGTNLGSATLDGQCHAVLTTSSIPAGTYNVVAVFQGSTNYSSSSSAPAPLIVAPPSIQMTASTSSVTASPNSGASLTLSIASVSGLGSGVVVSSGPAGAYTTVVCKGLPSNALCVFSPQYFTLAPSPATAAVAPTPVNVSILVNASPGSEKLPTVSKASPRKTTAPLVCSLFFSLPLLTLFGRRKFRSRMGTLFMLSLLFLALCLGLAGCGTAPATHVTPTGTFPVTITTTSTTPGSAGITATTSLTINLTVTQ